MKKNFVKKLAVALSLAMAVSTLAPAANADAAAAPKFKSTSVTVNAGQTKKYNTANSKKYSVSFKIGNKSVATINYSKGSKAVRVTGVTAGKTTLRADFKSYSTKKVTTKKIPVTVPYDTATEIHVLGKDAKGVTVFDAMMSNAADNKLDITVETTQGYMTGDKLVLLEKGNTAKVTATLHTYEYNTDGTEKDVIKTEATVTAVDPEVVSLTGTKYTVAKSLDWTKPLNTKLAVEDKNTYLYFQLKSSKDEDVTNDYTTLASSDNNVLLVGTATNGVALLTPVKEGTAYVLVKDSKDNVVASFAITVVGERKPTSMILEPATVTVSNALADKMTTKVVVKDQYSNDMTAPDSVTITEVSYPAGVVKADKTLDATKMPKLGYASSIVVAANNANTITKNLEAGSYTVKVQFKDVADASKTIEATTGFVVEDNQPGVTYTVKKNSVSDADIQSAVRNNVVFYYNGKEITNTALITCDPADCKVSGNTYAAIKVTVNVTVTASGTDYTVPVALTLNQAITINQ